MSTKFILTGVHAPRYEVQAMGTLDIKGARWRLQGTELPGLDSMPGCTRHGNRLTVPRNVVEAFHSTGVYQCPQALQPFVLSERIRPSALRALLPFQRDGLRRALHSEGFHFHWAPGAGKTLGALCWAMATSGRVLFITRAAALGTIRDEVRKWTRATPVVLRGQDPSLRRVRVKYAKEVWSAGTKKTRQRISVERERYADTRVDPRTIVSDADVAIISYEVLPFWIDALSAIAFSAVVFDEVHRVKGWKRRETRHDENGQPFYVDLENQASAAARASKLAPRRLATTATPIRDRPRDLWAQLDIIEPGCWGSNWDFTGRYCDRQPGQWGGYDTRGSSNEAELAARLAIISHVVPYSVTHAELPAKRREVARLDADDLVRIPRSVKAIDLPGGIHGDIFLSSLQKRAWVVERAATAMASGQKVVIFTGLRIDAELTGEALRKAAPASGQVFIAHGGTSASGRDDIRSQYMSATTAVAIVGTGDAWGESVNLQDTDLAIFSSLPFTPGQLSQWEGRFSRHGQKRPVLILYPIAPLPIDEHVASLLLDKLAPFDTLVRNEALAGARDALGGPLPSDEEMQSALALLVKRGGDVDD